MKAHVIYETYFTNTEKIATAIATGLRTAGVDVTLEHVSSKLIPDAAADLLVLGAPTHNLGLPKRATRRQAAAKGGQPHDTGILEWLDNLAASGRRVAVFCTATGGAFAGSAAKALAKKLRKKGIDVVASADFIVQGVEGPLAKSEVERAAIWGAKLA